MWVFTKDGFFSVVQKHEQAGTQMLTIRARNRSDLVKAKKAMGIKRCKIISKGGTDYEFRMVLPKIKWAAYLNQQTIDLDYENFKNEVHKIDHKRAGIYSRVWSELLDIASNTWSRTPFKNKKHKSDIWYGGMNY